MESIFTWEDLIKLFIASVLLFVLLKFVGKISIKLSKKTKTKHRLQRLFDTIFVFYIPIGIGFILIVYVGINLFIHGALLLVVGITTFTYIKNYISGILFKSNPLVDRGSHFIFGDNTGVIERLLPFGVIIKGVKGEKYISYTEIEKQGFGIKKIDGEGHLKVLHLQIEDEKIIVKDLLFDTPLVNSHYAPVLKKNLGDNNYKLQFTLEKGATLEEVVDYLEQYHIKATIHK